MNHRRTPKNFLVSKTVFTLSFAVIASELLEDIKWGGAHSPLEAGPGVCTYFAFWKLGERVFEAFKFTFVKIAVAHN